MEIIEDLTGDLTSRITAGEYISKWRQADGHQKFAYSLGTNVSNAVLYIDFSLDGKNLLQDSSKTIIATTPITHISSTLRARYVRIRASNVGTTLTLNTFFIN
jgi:hypothetical protein